MLLPSSRFNVVQDGTVNFAVFNLEFNDSVNVKLQDGRVLPIIDPELQQQLVPICQTKRLPKISLLLNSNGILMRHIPNHLQKHEWAHL